MRAGLRRVNPALLCRDDAQIEAPQTGCTVPAMQRLHSAQLRSRTSAPCRTAHARQLQGSCVSWQPAVHLHHGCRRRCKRSDGSGHGGRCVRVGAFDASQALQEFSALSSSPSPGPLYGLLVNTAVFTFGYSILRKGLTPVGVANAWFLGASVLTAFGLKGYVLVCLYFILGTLVTKLKMKQKQREGIAEARSGQRGPASVWGSGLAATVCACVALAFGSTNPWRVGFVASICSKLSDTVSSEVGKAYGQTTYLITTLQRVPRGTEGAVSAEGTLAGIAAAVAFTGLACALGQATVPSSVAIGAAAVVANIAESYLGAIVQGRVAWLTNDLVNMLQISLAAVLAMGAHVALGL